MRWLTALLLIWGAVLPAAAADFVIIPDREVALRAALVRPPGAGPFPAVVALHGCEGMSAGGDLVVDHYRAWAERLAESGYVVLLPDSFSSRGAGPQCRVRERRIRPRFERVRDANAARRWLQAQPWVQPNRVYLMGWSHGATSALWTVRPQISPGAGDRDFRSTLVFYPNCAELARAAWSARVPTLLLLGAADDWTLLRSCSAMLDGAQGRSAKVDVIAYPGAVHGFDHPNNPVHLQTGLAFTPDGSGRAHIGTNAAARDDSIRRVLEWLER